MGVETKALFMRLLEDDLRSAVIASDLAKIMSIVANQLGKFDLTRSECAMERTDDLLEAYLSALNIQGKSAKTIERYKYVIERMNNSLKLNTRNITIYHLREYLSNEKKRGINDSTLEGIRQIICAYFNWLKKESLIDRNPAANLGSIKCQKKVREAYTEVELEKLKMQAKTTRDKAIICFLLSTACRINEMCQLNIRDVDFENLECTVLGKGNKERTVYIDSVTAMLVREYLDNRNDDCEALFVVNLGKAERISPGGVRRMLKTLGEAAGIKNVYPHKFRRTKATTLIKHGMPIQEVASILGHEKLDTTMKYVVMDKTQVKNSYKKYT